MRYYLDGKLLRLDPRRQRGEGGEAIIYELDQSGWAAKIFKQPDHPDFQGNPATQQAVAERLKEHREKLLQFPKGLPPQVVTPDSLIFADANGYEVVGYKMRFLSGADVLLHYTDRGFRESSVSNQMMTLILQKILAITGGVHQAGVVIGDKNDLNWLISNGTDPNLIDADSAQFGKFLCRLFTETFVDPLLCDPKEERLVLSKPHNKESDLYAFAVMLMRTLLFVGPYGGVYRPSSSAKKIKPSARPLHRITVFHQDVQYPKPALRYDILPDNLLQHLHQVFTKDKRGGFPKELLDLNWTTCDTCHKEHARNKCPFCAQTAPAAIKETIVIRGNVKSHEYFKTSGTIICATFQDNELRWLYHEDGKFKREDRGVLANGPLIPHMRFRIRGKGTIMARGKQAFLIEGGQQKVIQVGTYGLVPMLDANDQHAYYTSGGRLLRENKDVITGQDEEFYIGDTLEDQTLLWVGPAFGFGFYRAGNICVAFIFDVKRRGVKDSIKLPPIKGQLIDSTCVFNKDYCWFFIATQESGKNINRCVVLKSDGNVEATAEADPNDGSWLATLRGKCAIGKNLFAPTDDGIVKLEIGGGTIQVAQEFPDTAPFVDTGCQIFPGKGGLNIVSHNAIRLITIS